jgi:hypothetical protein
MTNQVHRLAELQRRKIILLEAYGQKKIKLMAVHQRGFQEKLCRR